MGSTIPLKGWQLIDYISITKCLKNNKVFILYQQYGIADSIISKNFLDPSTDKLGTTDMH